MREICLLGVGEEHQEKTKALILYFIPKIIT